MGQGDRPRPGHSRGAGIASKAARRHQPWGRWSPPAASLGTPVLRLPVEMHAIPAAIQVPCWTASVKVPLAIHQRVTLQFGYAFERERPPAPCLRQPIQIPKV